MAISWMSKGSLTAAMTGTLLNESIRKGDLYSEYQLYGSINLTCALLSVVILSPMSSIIMETLGHNLLSEKN